MSVVTVVSAGYVTKTSFVPAEKFTKLPELLDARTVVRASVVPADVYVPTPTSHSAVPCPAMRKHWWTPS